MPAATLPFQHVAGWIFLIVFNLATGLILRTVLSRIDVASLVAEKAPLAPPAPAAGTQVAKGGTEGKDAAPDTSYSRVAGLIGAVILSVFLWAVANVLLYFMMFGAVDQVGSIVAVVPQVLLPGATLFAPYAVNQLRTSITK